MGYILLQVDQRSSPRRNDHGVSSDPRQADTVVDAGGRQRLYTSRIAYQPVVDSAFSAEQQRRKIQSESRGRRTHEIISGFDRADAMAGKARQGPGFRRQDSGRDRSHDGYQLPEDSSRLCPWLPASAARARKPPLSVALR